MSTPRDLTLDDAIRVDQTSTARGDFTTFECVASKTPLPHGNALLIPGFTGSKEDFGPMLPLLADVGWAVATYDQRGQFETAGDPRDDYSLDGFAADAVAVAAALFGDAEEVHLVGHSFGGLVAATAALNAPTRWASLTLLCSGPGGLPDRAGRGEMLATADSIATLGLEASYRDKRERDLRRGFVPPSPEIEAFLHRRFLSNSVESLSAIARLLAVAPDRTAELARLDLPIRVIRGADDDAWPHAVQDTLAKTLGTHVEVIKGAAHSPAVEQPEATRDALARAWLA